MLRPHALLLTFVCLLLCISYLPTDTSMSQAANHSLSLNGSSGYMSVPNSTSINITGPITIEAWVKVTALTGNYQEIVYRHTWQVPGTGGGYEFTITNTGKVRLDLYQSHNQYTTVIGSTTITTGAWHHVAGVFDGTQMRVYLNGVLDGSLWTTNGPASGNSPLKIGLNTGGTYYFGGLIDQVRISAAALYSSSFSPGLGPANQTRAYWTFDGQTANDSSGNGNHGTLQSGATYATDTSPSGGGGSQRPVAVSGGPYNGLINQAVQLNGSSSFDPDGTITAHHWNFGDGTSANNANSSHTYTAPGLYTATLTVADNAGLLASATASVNIQGPSNARLDPRNQTGGGGENPLSRNFNWKLPLVNLPGRAGMDLELSLSYNSLIWIRNGNYISFDEDRGFPSPGFRLGFPIILPPYHNAEVGKDAFLLIGSDGSRTELRRVGSGTTSQLFEAADSSHLLLDSNNMILRAADGTQLQYEFIGNQYQCTEIKDRNGNFITINYNPSGRIDNIHDTLGRVISFNYENGLLSSITQTWKKPTNLAETITHTWASFSYTELPIQPNFSGLSVLGLNGSTIKLLTKVTLDDNSTTPAQNSHFDFEYTPWGQIWKISNFAADNHLLNYRSYKLPGSPLWTNPPAQTDCPRFTERRDWAEKWNQNVSGIEQEAITSYTAPEPGTANVPGKAAQSATFVQVTNPNGTSTKVYFLGSAGTSTGWKVGLEYLVDSYECLDVNAINPCSNSSLVRQVETLWTQDDETKAYALNPRVQESNVFDPSGNRRRTKIVYETFNFADATSCRLPKYVHEYKSDATNYLRTTHISYVDHADYAPRRILGLISDQRLREGGENGTVVSWVSYAYDEIGSIDGANTPTNHDDDIYGPAFRVGRGNVTSITRHDVLNSTTSSSRRRYDRAGSVISLKDPLDHEVKFGYEDNFSDGDTSRHTFAYPKTVTDPDDFITTFTYNFDFGAVVSTQTPKPGISVYQAGPIRTTHFDNLGRVERITNSVNDSYTRYEYSQSGNRLDVFSNMTSGASQQNGTEGQTFVVFDGAGRTIGSATKRSAGGFNGQRFEYDRVGRKVKTSNPTETGATGSPFVWSATGADVSTGWKFTQQTYDWKGRVKSTINQDGTTRTAEYSGCGCAGGDVVTLTDEGTLVGGVPKRRRQTLHHDVVGRLVKTEVWDFEGTAPDGVSRRLDSTTVTTYNVRDQVTLVRQHAGAEGSGTFQDTSMTYDGFGRLETQHQPHQQAFQNQPWTSDHTTFHYDAEDKLDYIVDARGVKKQFNYQNNKRHLVTGLSYDLSALPTGQTSVPAVFAATFEYTAVGLRKKMTDGTGSITYNYNDLSQLTSEIREFADPDGTYTLNYEYELGGQLKKITDHNNSTINYNYDTAGQLSGVTGEGNLIANVSNYASGFEYRAWGATRNVNFGNGANQQTNFNSRFQATGGSINGLAPGISSVSWSYDYYDDGRQKHAYNAFDNRFDRLLEYDHVGRLKAAYSGREARGLPPTTPFPDNPYQQNFEYDAFNNQIQKAGRFWRTGQNGSTPCLPRQQTDGCDSEGNLINQSQQIRVYDAANNQVKFEDWRHPVGGSPNHPEVEPGVMIRQTYDSDGRPTKRIETRQTEELIGSGPQTNILLTETPTLYIYSTVLGGAKLVELGGGHVSTTYVYANGMRIAKQNIEFSSSNNSVTWNHVNPGSNSFVESFSDASIRLEERDPDGAEVGLEDPWANIQEPPTYENLKDQEPLYIEGGNPFDYNSGSTIDGLPVSASEFARRAGSGSLAASLSGAISGMAPVVPLGLGIFGYERPAGWNHDDEGPALEWETHTFSASGQSRRRTLQHHPQNPTEKPMDTSQTERLLTGECVHFLNSILAELGKIVDPYSYNFLGIFRKAKDQRRLYTKRMTPEERQRHRGVGGTNSIVGDPGFSIWIDEYRAYESGDNGYTLIHELFHGAAGSGTGYNHSDMATAAYNAAQANPALMKEVRRHGIKGPVQVRYTREGYVEGDDFKNASVFDNILRLGCPQPK